VQPEGAIGIKEQTPFNVPPKLQSVEAAIAAQSLASLQA
jgi:hypothetical protein